MIPPYIFCRFKDICDGKVSVPFLTVMKDVTLVRQGEDRKETTINKIQDYQLDPVLSEYFRQPEIVKYVECFTGPDIMAAHTMLINKVNLPLEWLFVVLFSWQ